MIDMIIPPLTNIFYANKLSTLNEIEFSPDLVLVSFFPHLFELTWVASE